LSADQQVLGHMVGGHVVCRECCRWRTESGELFSSVLLLVVVVVVVVAWILLQLAGQKLSDHQIDSSLVAR